MMVDFGNIFLLRQVLGCLSVSIASMLWGMSIVWSAVALPHLRQALNTSFAVDDSSASWIGSSMPVGGSIGGLVVGTCIDVFGRKKFMMVLYTTFAVGWGLVAFSPSLAVVCIGKSHFFTNLAK